METTFRNDGAAPAVVWLGDVIDHDGPGSRSGVGGVGTITSGTPRDYPMTEPWIGQTGDTGQTYGLVYEDPPAGLGAYAVAIWNMTKLRAVIPAGESVVLRRRIVAADARGASDPFDPLREVATVE